MLIVIGLSVFFVLSCSRDAACRVRLLLVCFCSHAFLFSRRLRKERRVFCIHAGAGGVASFATTEGADVGEGVTICVSSCGRDEACRVRMFVCCFYGRGMPRPYEWVNCVLCFLLPPMQERAGEGAFSPYPLSNRANLLLMVCPGLVATICPFMGLPTRAMSPMMSSSLCLAGSLSHTRGLCCM